MEQNKEETKESNLRLCKKCNEVKRRTLAGKFPDGRDKRYVDDSGKLWNGSMCPSCNAERAREVMSAKRKRKANDQVS